MRLNDGTVIPNYLDVRNNPGDSGFQRAMTDYGLHVGRIIASHPPSADTNTNKKFWEYDVKVDLVANGTHTEVVYPRCQLANTFGGVADFMRWTPRLGAQSTNEDGTAISTGSRVYLMCVNGNTRSGVIIGGQNHVANTSDPQEDGAALFVGEFNGIRIEVSKDGNLTILHRGATNPDGTVIDDDSTKNGTSIVLNQNGDIKLSTGADGNNTVWLDSQNKKIIVDADELVEIEASGNVKIKSAGVLIGAATDNTMLGSTFRKDLSDCNSTLISGLLTISNLILTAAIGITTAAAAHATPITGPVVGAPSLAAAGAALQSTVPTVNQMMLALQTLEAKSAGHLSTKNKSD